MKPALDSIMSVRLIELDRGLIVLQCYSLYILYKKFVTDNDTSKSSIFSLLC